MTVTAKKITQHTRDFTDTADVVTIDLFVVAIIKNIGNDALCVKVGSLNFAIPPDKVGVFSGGYGTFDAGGATYTLAPALGFSARSITSAGTRARITVIS